ncbi:ABC transporter permease [Leifsonia sp. AG29]|uniref:ABC transporter permease n=1 Tax=Leifsonia sp. AG29 TaxID=2598860 RepID=UPI00131AB0F3|nr:ABC transporter permease subunit [Leifsonia sp. AG29]
MTAKKALRYAIPIGFYLLALVAWQVGTATTMAPGSAIVPPSTIASTLVDRWNAIVLVSGQTLAEAGLGFAIGAASAVLLSVVIDRFRTAGTALYWLALLLYAVPVIAIAAPLTAWFGLGMASKVAVSALSAYFPVLVNVTGALRTLDPRVEELGRVLAMGYFRRLLRLRAPAVLPALFSSFAIAGPAAFIGAILAEWMGAELGLGVMILQSMFNFDVPLLWTVILVATVLNGLIVLFFSVIGRAATPWHRSARPGGASA